MLRIHAGLHRVLAVITAITLVAMMVHIVLHALLRYFFSAPIYGTNEIVAYWYLPILALVGIPAATLQKEHITVTLAVDQMNKSTANVFIVFAAALGTLMSLGFAWFGLQEALSKMSMRSTAGVTDISTWPAYFVVPLVFFLLSFLFVGEIVAIIRSGSTPVVEGLNEVSMVMTESADPQQENDRSN